ncbi:MAG TPA: phenylalanine--tRNA ligase subunit beta [Chloroflexota bacterium]
MRVSLSWLREYVPVEGSIDDLAHRLTLAGIEVANVERMGGSWEKIYVGEIVALDRHPNADRLQIATVDYGQGSSTVVTGAPNLNVGDRVPFALVGAELIDMHQDPPRSARLRPAKIRGVESLGMVCSAAELGLGGDHAGILILDPSTPVGRPLADVIGDTVLELELTPNRSDCLSMLGVAQEVAALIVQPFREPSLEVEGEGPPTAERVEVEILDQDLCRRYSAAIVEGVEVGPSPRWLQDRLVAAEVRPINNVVDVTNYVMLEYGQPLHAFDFAKLAGGKIVVRRARPGERLRTLDGVDRALEGEMLVIADAERPVAVAGVMGGQESEVSERTTTVLLEAANFDPISVRRTSRGLKLPSEASRRFEKGLPPELTVIALTRAAQLLRDLAAPADGSPRIGRGWADCYPVPAAPRTVTLPLAEFERLLGRPYEAGEVTAVLERLGFDVGREGEDLQVVVPYRRVDVAIPADVVEEVARVQGYDALPTTALAGRLPDPTPADAAFRLEEQLRDILVGCGLFEVITYPWLSEARLEKVSFGLHAAPLARELDARLLPDVEPIRIVNPLSSESELMRTTAVVHLLETVRDNLRWTDRDVQVFEIGRIYLRRDGGGELPEERRVLTIATGGYRSGSDWGSRRPIDFYDLKGVVERALEELGVGHVDVQPLEHSLFRSGQAAALTLPGRRGQEPVLLGALGEVAARVRRSFDLDEPTFLAALDLSRAFAARGGLQPVRSLARYPAIYQDLALVLAEDVSSEQVRRLILRAGRPLAVEASLFDVYRGERIGAGQRSLAYRITYQSRERTLTDREVADAHGRIESALARELGARVRGR